MKTLADQLACAKRELAMRKNCYPKWVQQGRMRPEAAQHEMECMEAIVHNIEKLIYLEQATQAILEKPTQL